MVAEHTFKDSGAAVSTRMLDTSKGSISRWLLELQDAHRIVVETTSHETRIRKVTSVV
ncbi:MAG: hypothetical protein AB7U75_17610 [Hyphomicrobiaceae bacterium]